MVIFNFSIVIEITISIINIVIGSKSMKFALPGPAG